MLRLVRNMSFAILLCAMSFIAQGNAQSPYGHYTGPHSLGLLNLDRNTPMKSFLGALGAISGGKEIYCFADKKNGLYLYIRPMPEDRLGHDNVGQLLLSSFANCSHLRIYQTTIDPSAWKTPEGIGIGSTKEEVTRAYQKPIRITKTDKNTTLLIIAGTITNSTMIHSLGDFSYLYSCLINEKQACNNDSPTTEIGFSKGKVIWIWTASSGSK